MEYCKYHPLEPATYTCDQCHTNYCDHCVDEGEVGDEERCFSCNRLVDSLGARFTAEPFWRRLQESFRYPLNTETIVLIVVIALLSTLVSFIPFTVIWLLMLAGAFMKYCFTCLEKTANGFLDAPSITVAYGGGLRLVLTLVAMLIIIGAIIIAIGVLVGEKFATFLSVIFLLSFPAMLINFAMTESAIDAINPLKAFRLIMAIGLPYGLLLALILIMLGSVSLIHSLIGDEFSLLVVSLQSIVFNYYTIVTFHIMGYMIFQYQRQLGFAARHSSANTETTRPATARLLAKIEVMVKEGRYGKALRLFQESIKRYPDNKMIYDQCFKFLLATKNVAELSDYATSYFRFLKANDSEDQLRVSYKKILQLNPQFMPEEADIRLMLANVCKEGGDSRSAVKLLNGLHKQFPDYGGLGAAYTLMADALQDIPGMEDKAGHYTNFVKKISRKNKT